MSFLKSVFALYVAALAGSVMACDPEHYAGPEFDPDPPLAGEPFVVVLTYNAGVMVRFPPPDHISVTMDGNLITIRSELVDTGLPGATTPHFVPIEPLPAGDYVLRVEEFFHGCPNPPRVVDERAFVVSGAPGIPAAVAIPALGQNALWLLTALLALAGARVAQRKPFA